MSLRNLVLVALSLCATVPAARADVTEAEIATCYRAPHVECLAEIGFELAMEAPSYPNQVIEVHLLGQIGWYEEAHALSVHSQMQQGKARTSAVSLADFITRDYRIIADLLAGRPPGDDLGLNTISAALQLLGQMQIDSSLHLRQTTDLNRLSAVRELAERLSSGTRNDQIIAANFFTIMGDHDRAISILETLKDDGSRPSTLSEDMIRMIGPVKTLAIYRRMGEVRPRYFVDLARVEPDPAKRLGYLRAMLAAAKARDEGEKLHATIGSVVVTAMEVGAERFARDVTDELKDMVGRGGSIRSLLALLRAQHAIGASEREQRKTLKRAQHVLKGTEVEAGFGQSLAWYYAQLGAIDEAVRLFDFDPNADQMDWANLIRRDMPESARMALLTVAQDRLTPADFAATLADIAGSLARPGKSAEENDWAQDTAWQLLDAAPPLQQKPKGYLYDNILRAAARLGDHALIEAALLQSARRALDSRDYRRVLQAAHQHHHLAQF